MHTAQLRDALCSAAEEGHAGIIKLLIRASENLASTNESTYGHADNICPLFDCNSEQDTALHLAAMNGHHEAVKVLLDGGAHPEAKDKLLETPLSLAVEEDHLETVRVLLEYKAD
ncbi:hypothetical protein ASPZODRAFT_76440, partial [Penicilliopsis zonata CBS 506.65]